MSLFAPVDYISWSVVTFDQHILIRRLRSTVLAEGFGRIHSVVRVGDNANYDNGIIGFFCDLSRILILLRVDTTRILPADTIRDQLILDVNLPFGAPIGPSLYADLYRIEGDVFSGPPLLTTSNHVLQDGTRIAELDPDWENMLRDKLRQQIGQ